MLEWIVFKPRGPESGCSRETGQRQASSGES